MLLLRRPWRDHITVERNALCSWGLHFASKRVSLDSTGYVIPANFLVPLSNQCYTTKNGGRQTAEKDHWGIEVQVKFVASRYSRAGLEVLGFSRR